MTGYGGSMKLAERAQALREALSKRIVVLDGAMGTMIQKHALGEAEYRGQRFADHSHDLKGANDILVLTQPKIIRDIHLDFVTVDFFGLVNDSCIFRFNPL